LGRGQVNPEGYDLYELIARLDLEDHVIYTDQVEYVAGLDEDVMRTMYSSFDILTQCTMGEGFGIPIIEAQACGVPVVGTNFSAIPEVIGEGGICVEIGEKIMWQRLGVFHAIPKVEKIVEAYQTIRDSYEKYVNLALMNSVNYDYSIWENEWTEYVRRGLWT
jgi:glycosyltransferase involved in cell wall biosynthesis